MGHKFVRKDGAVERVEIFYVACVGSERRSHYLMAERWLFKTEPSAYSWAELDERDGAPCGRCQARARPEHPPPCQRRRVLASTATESVIGSRNRARGYPYPKQNPRLGGGPPAAAALARPVPLADISRTSNSGLRSSCACRSSVMPVRRKLAAIMGCEGLAGCGRADPVALPGSCSAAKRIAIAGRGRPRRGPRPALVPPGVPPHAVTRSWRCRAVRSPGRRCRRALGCSRDRGAGRARRARLGRACREPSLRLASARRTRSTRSACRAGCRAWALACDD